jgi:hypothetical protein
MTTRAIREETRCPVARVRELASEKSEEGGGRKREKDVDASVTLKHQPPY